VEEAPVPLSPSTAPSRVRVIEVLALALLVALAVVAVANVPSSSWLASPLDPCHVAVVAGAATIVFLVAARSLGDRAVPTERVALAFFLAAMPLVYVSSWFWSPHPSAGQLGLEVGAVPLFGALAWVGASRSPWVLAAGIAGHGVLWDAWHLVRTSVVPDWYASGCLLFDVGLAVYIASRVPTWNRILARPNPALCEISSET